MFHYVNDNFAQILKCNVNRERKPTVWPIGKYNKICKIQRFRKFLKRWMIGNLDRMNDLLFNKSTQSSRYVP